MANLIIQRLVYVAHVQRIPLLYNFTFLKPSDNVTLFVPKKSVKQCEDTCITWKCSCVLAGDRADDRFYLHAFLHEHMEDGCDVLFQHFDMFVDTRRLQRDVINLPRGITCMDFNATRRRTNWTWDHGADRECPRFAASHMNEDKSVLSWMDRLCVRACAIRFLAA